MELSDSRNRGKRKLPEFMYGATFPRDTVGSGGSTYGGALEWLRKHQEYLNQSLRYIQRYPNLIQDKLMDPFWDFLEPLIYNNNLLIKYDDFLKTQFGFKERYQLEDKFGQQLPTPATYFKTDIDMRRSDYNYPVRRVFFCFDRTSSHHHNLKHLIVDQLEPFVCVRTNPTPEQAKVVNSMDICRAICGSTFIMLVNDNVLQDQICLNLLSIAIAYKSPIIFLRESGYLLPTDIPDTQIEFVKPPVNAPFAPNNHGSVSENIVNHQDRRYKKSKMSDEANESEDIGMQVLKKKEEVAKEKVAEAELSISLAERIGELYTQSLVFNTNMFESTLALLYDKVASYTGVTFPSSVPQQATDEAAQLSRMFNVASIKMSDRPIYKVGTARTTLGFHQALKERGQLPTSANRSNNNSETVRPHVPSEQVIMSLKELHGCQIGSTGRSSQAGSSSDDSGILTSETRTEDVITFQTFSSDHKTETKSMEDFTSALLPSPPKVMRTDNLQGKFTDPHRGNAFRPNYPSNSRLLRYRPDSSRPSSARSRVLLQTHLPMNTADAEPGE